MRLYSVFIKRLFDVVAAVAVLIAVAPIMLILIPLLNIMLGKPIFFRQQRPGFAESHSHSQIPHDDK